MQAGLMYVCGSGRSWLRQDRPHNKEGGDPRDNTFQRRRFASQTKPLQDCHPFASRLVQALSGAKDLCPARDPKLALRMTKPDGLFFRNVLPPRECPYTSYVYLKSCYRGSIWRRVSARGNGLLFFRSLLFVTPHCLRLQSLDPPPG